MVRARQRGRVRAEARLTPIAIITCRVLLRDPVAKNSLGDLHACNISA